MKFIVGLCGGCSEEEVFTNPAVLHPYEFWQQFSPCEYGDLALWNVPKRILAS